MANASLKRTADVKGAVFLGLGSILGTGVFVVLMMVTGMVGEWVLLAVAVGGIVATFNGLNSAARGGAPGLRRRLRVWLPLGASAGGLHGGADVSAGQKR